MTPGTARRRIRVGTALGALLAAVLTGCQDVSDDRADPPDAGDRTASSAGPTAADLPAVPADLDRYYRQQVDWQDCDGWQCARVQVPLDYAEPGGRSIELAVNRRPADDADRRQGALLVNPGGPGASGIRYARVLAPNLGDVLSAYDVVGFDPRGVGDSAAVDCLDDEELDAYLGSDASPDDPGEVRRLLAQSQRLGAQCQQRSGALLGHVSTVEAARDLDILRHVAGDPRLHYFGVSYGTLLGATYADLFPERVGRMVLDGAVHPTARGVRMNLDQLRGFETALQAYLADCVDGEGCPLGRTVGEAERNLADLLARIDNEPLPTGQDRELTAGWALFGLALPLYADELWPVLTQALGSAVRGEGGPLLRLADLYVSRSPTGYMDNSMEAFVAISCLDDPTERSVAEVRRDLPRFERVSRAFGAEFAWSTLGCPGWPVRASEEPPRIDAPGAAPILVLGTTRDPATPYPWAQAMARALESGVLLTRVGDGHGGYGRGNDCIDDAVRDYLLRGTMPAAATRC